MKNSGGRTVGLWLIGILLMQAAWIITVPPFRGSDEFDHAFRAAAVADGEWYVDEWAEDGRGLYVTAPTSLVEAARFQCESLPYTGRENCHPDVVANSETVQVASGAGLYHPLFYWIVGSVAQPFEGATALYAMRIATAVLCLVFFGVAAWAVSRLPSRWPLAALTVAASPVLIYSTTIVAPNGPEMAAAMALWATLLSAARQPDARDVRVKLILAIPAAMTLSTLRMLGPLFVMLIVATVITYAPSSARRVVREHRGLITAAVAASAFAAAGSAVWVVANNQTEAPPGETGGAVDLGHILMWNFQTIAAFPFRDQAGPLIVYPIYLGLVLALLVGGYARGRWPARSALLLAMGTTIALPALLTLATMEGRGVIWQGRYALPYAIGTVILAGFAISHRPTRPVTWRIAAPGAVAIGVGVAACLIKIRTDEVSRGSGDLWLAPHPIVLIALLTAAVTALAAAVSTGERVRRG